MMIGMRHLLKTAAAWASIVYVVCFGAVMLFPEIRQWFMRYALHVDVDMGNVITPFTFVTGLIIWNVTMVLAVWLFAALYNRIGQ